MLDSVSSILKRSAQASSGRQTSWSLTMISVIIAITAHKAARLSPALIAWAMYEPSPGSLRSRFITVMASLWATKNQPPPKDIMEFQIRLCAEAGSSTVVKRCQRLMP